MKKKIFEPRFGNTILLQWQQLFVNFYFLIRNKKLTTLVLIVFYSAITTIASFLLTSCSNKKEIPDGPKPESASVQQKDEIELSELQLQLGNVHTDTIRNGTIGDQLVLTATLNFAALVQPCQVFHVFAVIIGVLSC